ncbi:MAG: MFS transporter [Propioniciclava sp.]|uniref:MFS transporter n=1 Tax=Propioniciclava sp. TaxID=2038686 RepID=UPI0039E72B0B
MKPDAYAWKAIGASIVGYAMDGFDLLILGFALPAITAEFGLSPVQAGSLATITLVGAVLGGFVGGIASDYIGRVRVLTYSIVVFAVFTGLTGLAPDFVSLAIFRFIAGIGLGAEFGVGMTLAAEAWPARMRARATSYVALGWQLGVLLAAVVSAVAIPLIGWRGLFLIGVLPAIVAAFVRHGVDEPELFKKKIAARTGKRQGPSPLAMLFSTPQAFKSSIAMITLTSVQNFGYYGVMIWLPSYLATRYEMSLTQSAVWTGVTIVGMAAGIWVFGALADRYGRRPILIIFQVGAVASVLGYSQLSDPTALLIGGAVMGVFVNGMMGGYGALMAELYPTQARATAQNVLFNIGRGVGGFGPIVVGAAALALGFPGAIALLAAIYLLDIVVTVFLIEERKGAELQ